MKVWLPKGISLKSAAIAALLACLAQIAHASQWTDIATVSSTMGNNANYLCTGAGATDLGCPTIAPYIDSAGKVGIGTTNPTQPLDVSGTLASQIHFSSGGKGGYLTSTNDGYAALSGGASFDGTSWQAQSSGAGILFSGGSGLIGFASNSGLTPGTTFSPTVQVSIHPSGHMGIGTTFGIDPATALEVVGTLKISNGGESCSATTLGAVKYASGAFYICQNATNGWEQISTSGGNFTTDHIASSTTSVYANGTGYISLTTGGTTTGYTDNTGRLVIPGVSITQGYGISSTNGYFSGNVGIGSSTSSYPLSVSGTAFITDALNSYTMLTSGGIELFRSPSETAPNVNGVIDFKSSGNEDYDIRQYYDGTANRMYFTNNASDGIGTTGTLFTIDRTGKVGIGTTNPSAPLEINSDATFAPTDIPQGDVALGSVSAAGWAGVGIVFSNSSASSTILNRDIVQNGGNLYFGRHTSSTNVLDMTITNNGMVTVSGTIKVADSGGACSASILGAVKYASGAFYICQNATNGWEQISTSGGATSDHIASSTTSVYANGTGYISLTTGGTTTGYLDTAGRLIAPGVSVTQNYGISSTNGYFSGKLGIGLAASFDASPSLLIAPPTALGASSGDSTTLVHMRQLASNVDYLSVTHRRYTAGSDWTSANYRLQRRVDVTNMGFIDFGVDGATGGAGLGFGAGTSTTMVLNNGKLGVGTTAPATAVDVSGTLKIADGGDACDASHLGSIKYNANKFYLCRNAATGWEELTIGGGSADVQTFTASGTWTKPATGTTTKIECWGGGGGGSRLTYSSGGGGGGGAYWTRTMPTSQLGATEAVTIGQGGAVDTNGGDSSFGTWLTAYAGGKSVYNGTARGGYGGGGGGISSAGNGQTAGGPAFSGYAGGSAGTDSLYGGGGGGDGFQTSGAAGGDSTYGGGGGGGKYNGSNKAGGTSTFGGAGGVGGSPGTQPGGGGGANAVGADGECIVTTY